MVSSVVLAIVIGVYALFLTVNATIFDILSPSGVTTPTSVTFLGLSENTQIATGVFCGMLFVFAIYTICRVTCCRSRTLESIKTEYETHGASKWRIIRAYQLFQWAKGPNSPQWAEFTLAKEGIETGLQIINVVACVLEKREREGEWAPACILESTLGRERAEGRKGTRLETCELERTGRGVRLLTNLSAYLHLSPTLAGTPNTASLYLRCTCTSL